jgi:hypothetical protein
MLLVSPVAGGSAHPPSWYPIELFDMVDASVPSGWLFRSAFEAARPRLAQGFEAVWGYPSLVADDGHLIALLEREPDAIATFLRESEASD